MVRLRKSGNEPACDGDYKFNNNENKLVSGFIDEVFSIKPSGNIEIIGDRVYIFPENLPKLNGLGVIRADVDNLFQSFISGFLETGNGNYETITRTSVFSRRISEFFNYHINYLLMFHQLYFFH